MAERERFDVLIVGSGLGGAGVAHVLADSGLRVLILERGDFLNQEKENWDVEAVAVKRRYDAEEQWIDSEGRPFSPRVYYNVGGSTKVFGAAALRLRREDFRRRAHEGGTTVGWPFPYEELEPYYRRAEALLGVHGNAGEDPTEAPRGPFPHPAIEHEPTIERLHRRLSRQGLHPLHLPLAIDQGPNGRCRKGSPCDGFPCMVRAKGDAENSLLRPILRAKNPNVTLRTGSYVERLETDESGTRVIAAHAVCGTARVVIEAGVFVVSAGAVNSAALLLRSASPHHPNGLANSSGLVGRCFMSHNNSVILALSPLRRNPTVFQKTLAIHDFYNSGSKRGGPLGTIQLRGKIKAEMLRTKRSLLLRLFASAIAERSIDLWVMSEDLPDADNRVTVDEQGRIHLARRPKNVEAHRQLVERAKSIMRKAGYPICIVDKRGVSAVQHQCGTARFGNDPRSSVLDQWCRSHDLPNLYVVDASFFPSSGAVNPSLTLLAQALRAAEHLKAEITTAAPARPKA